MFVEGFRSRYFPLKQWLLRRGHQTSSNITWECVRHSNSHCPIPDPLHQGLRAGPSGLCFCSTLKCEKHRSTRNHFLSSSPQQPAAGQYCHTYSTSENIRSQGSSSDSRLWTPHWLLSLPAFTKAPRWWGRQSIRGYWNLRCAPVETSWASLPHDPEHCLSGTDGEEKLHKVYGGERRESWPVGIVRSDKLVRGLNLT